MRAGDGSHLARLVGEYGTHAGPAYAGLATALRLLVLDGRLPLGSRLPGERELAAALGVSRTTVTAAYERLRSQGYALSRQGSGTTVRLPVDPAIPAGSWSPVPRSGLFELTHAAPAAPPAVAEAYAVALEALPAHMGGHGYEPLGLPELRAAVAARFTARGLPTTPAQVLVTNGAQHAHALVLTVLARPGDRLLVEHPSYPHALDAAARHHLRAVPVACTDDGWDLDAVRAALRQTAPSLAYTIPDFHNPTGLLMADATRGALAALLARAGTRAVVDETLVELPLDGQSMPAPFATHAPDAIVLGSASKAWWGGLRVGWVRADPATVRRLGAARATLDAGTPVVEQLAAAHLLGTAAGLPERRRDLAAARDTLRAALASRLPDWRVNRPAGGLVLWCDLGRPVSSALVAAAAQHGVRLAPGPRFGLDGAFERWLRLPYTLAPAALVSAVDAIALAHASVVGGAAAIGIGVGEEDAVLVTLS